MDRKVSPDFYKKTVKNSFEDYTGIDKSREEKKSVFQNYRPDGSILEGILRCFLG